MGFLDSILGRSKPVQANLDALFALPSAAITLQTEAGFVPSTQAGVCFKPVLEASFENMQGDMSQLLGMLKSQHELEIKEQDDTLGYHWMVITEPQVEDLVSNVHLINSSLQEAGFGPQLLCSVFGFTSAPERPAKQTVYLIYLYKRGTFYPFAPLTGEKRDNALELRLKGLMAKDLHVEGDLTRWFPVWGVPVS
jgi:hypothetical protein